MNPKKIKDTIISYRKALGLSQQELANRCHLTQSTISTLENGEFYPSMYSFLMVCEGFNVPPSQFFLSESDSTEELETDAKEMLQIWNRLNSTNRDLGLSILQCILDTQE